MSFFARSTNNSPFSTATSNPGVSSDKEVQDGPTESVSQLRFSPTHDFISASCWDGLTRIYEVMPDGSTAGKAIIKHEWPVLSTCWSADGQRIFSAGADKLCKMLDISTQQVTTVAGHDAPISSCVFTGQGAGSAANMLITSSWDKTAKYWDLRTSNPVFTLPLPDRSYTMDTTGQLLVIGTAGKNINIYDLNNPSTVFKSMVSSLKKQITVVRCFIDAKGFAVGGIEGRVSIEYCAPADQALKFSFKCHRVKQKDAFPVNDIAFHPRFGTMATMGGEGGFNFWDKDSKRSLKAFELSDNNPITAGCFNRSGTIFAYAKGEDWSRGREHANPTINKPKIMLHSTPEDEIKNKPKT